MEQETLTASDGAPGDFFGESVALSRNGRIALVGATLADCPTGNNCGAVYVFRK
jgi:hypothetical protein